MTSEEDFWRQIDQNPKDWMTRLVFADWLSDHDDPRAEGMRALGVLRTGVHFASGDRVWAIFSTEWTLKGHSDPSCGVPKDWIKAVRRTEFVHTWDNFGCVFTVERNVSRVSDLLNALAWAFFNLLPERKLELLQPKEQLV